MSERVIMDVKLNMSRVLYICIVINTVNENKNSLKKKKKKIFNIDSFPISCQETVKLLGIDIDFQLKFDLHIKENAERLLNS